MLSSCLLLPERVWADRQLCLGHLFLSCGWLQASCSSVCVEAWSCGRLAATRPSDVRFKHRQIDVNQITRRPRIMLVKSHFRAMRERDGERERKSGVLFILPAKGTDFEAWFNFLMRERPAPASCSALRLNKAVNQHYSEKHYSTPWQAWLLRDISIPQEYSSLLTNAALGGWN